MYYSSPSRGYAASSFVGAKVKYHGKISGDDMGVVHLVRQAEEGRGAGATITELMHVSLHTFSKPSIWSVTRLSKNSIQVTHKASAPGNGTQGIQTVPGGESGVLLREKRRGMNAGQPQYEHQQNKHQRQRRHWVIAPGAFHIRERGGYLSIVHKSDSVQNNTRGGALGYGGRSFEGHHAKLSTVI